MPLNKSYITHPQRIYHNPLAPETSDYDEVIPVTTSDAVIMEGTTITLTQQIEELKEGVSVDQRNATVVGSDIIDTLQSEGVNIATETGTITSGEYNNQEYYRTQAFDGIMDASHMWWSKQTWKGGADLPLYGYTGIDGNTYLIDKVITETGTCNYLIAPLPSMTWYTRNVEVIDGVITLEGGITLTRDTSVDVGMWSGENYPPYLVNGQAYVGNKDLMQKITVIKFSQAPYYSAAVSSVKVQYSLDNGTTWTDLQTFSTPIQSDYTSFTYLNLPDYVVPEFPYAIRLLANSDVGGTTSNRYPCWQVTEVELMANASGVGIKAGNFVATIAEGFNDEGFPKDTTLQKTRYETISLPTLVNCFLILKSDGEYEYVQYFYGGRAFPENPKDGEVYFNDQLRQCYKYVAGSPGSWEPYPCTAIARFEDGILAEILPFNTWWWDEVVYEDIVVDVPVGLEIGVVNDTYDKLRVSTGNVVDNNLLYKLSSPYIKDVTQPFAMGNGEGCADGSYTTTLTNLIPEDITPTNTYGFVIKSFNTRTDSPNEAYGMLNPDYNVTYPRWQAFNAPAACTIELPGSDKRCIKKYSVTSFCDSTRTYRICVEWGLYGSNDGNNWDLIHYVKDAGFTDKGQTKSWVTGSDKEYHYIKLVQVRNLGENDPGQFISIGQVRFYTGAPKLNVFAITDGTITDIVTSVLEYPLIPYGYINYKQLGSIVLTGDDSITLVNPYPRKDLSEEFVKGFPYLSEKVDSLANRDLTNLSKEGLLNLVNDVMPNYLSYNEFNFPYQAVLPNVVYQATEPGYIWFSNGGTDITDGNGIKVSWNKERITSEEDSSQWAYRSETGGSAIIPIPKGIFYKNVFVNGTIYYSIFVPAVGQQYNN